MVLKTIGSNAGRARFGCRWLRRPKISRSRTGDSENAVVSSGLAGRCAFQVASHSLLSGARHLDVLSALQISLYAAPSLVVGGRSRDSVDVVGAADCVVEVKSRRPS